MENIAYRTLKDVLQIVNVTHYPLGLNLYRHKILDALSKSLHEVLLIRKKVDIVFHIFKGLRNAEVAQKLFASEITVEKHRQNIFEKSM